MEEENQKIKKNKKKIGIQSFMGLFYILFKFTKKLIEKKNRKKKFEKFTL
jgi:hypothetical protein